MDNDDDLKDFKEPIYYKEKLDDLNKIETNSLKIKKRKNNE